MSTSHEARLQRMANPAYAAHINGIVAEMPAPTEESTRTVRALIQTGRREAARTEAARKTA